MTAAVGTPPVHDLLLGMAGRVDDDLLAWARELLAVGDDDQAVELVTAAVAADRVVLPPSLRAALVAAARVAHTDLDVDRALPSGSAEAMMAHRFDAAAGSGDAVVAALTALPGRRLEGCTAYLTWRRTAAGAAPGPLPHPVVLVEVDADRSPEVLAYVLATELERAGAPASVEVFTAGAPLPAYHTAALRTARQVVSRPSGDGPTRPGEPADLGGPADVDPQAGGPGDVEDVAAPTDVAVPVDPDHVDRRSDADPTPTPLFLVPAPNASGPGSNPDERAAPPAHSPAEAGAPRPGRRRRAEPTTPDAPSADLPRPTPDAPTPVDPAPVESSPEADPFRGPLRAPLLAPLLDPTGPEPAASDPVPDPTWSAPAATDLPRRRSRAANEAASEPAPASPPPSTPGPGDDGAVPKEWEEDWRSGEWAMPQAPRPQRADEAASGTSDHVPLFESPTAQSRSVPLPKRARDGAPPPADDPLFGPLDRDRLLFDDAGPSSGGPPLFHDVRAPARPAPDGPPFGGRPGRAGRHEDRPFGDAAALRESGQDPSAPRPVPDTPATGRRRRGAEAGPVAPSTPGSVNPPVPTAPGPPPPGPSTPGPPPGPSPSGPPPAGPSTPAPPPAGPSPSGQTPPGPGPAEPRTDAARPAPPPGPDGEPSRLLSGTERDLLSQLHAELSLPERRPRPYRRASRPGAAEAVNGYGHSPAPDGERPPPDLAG